MICLQHLCNETIACAGAHRRSNCVMLFGMSALLNVASSQSDLYLVFPGSAMESYLYHKVNGTHTGSDADGSGDQMPKNADPMSADEVGMIQTWIDEGAQP